MSSKNTENAPKTADDSKEDSAIDSGNVPKNSSENVATDGTPSPHPRPVSPRARTRRELGIEGESRAASYLQRRGYRIDARNVRYDGVEIDLVARRGRVVAFVEVKTRRSDRFGAPELAVDRRRQDRMIRAAHAWRALQPGSRRRIRFDVISIRVEGKGERERWHLDHFISAFDASR